ncbi:ChrR family anti-sigma-E factor [Hyphomonas pacifica]|uniref:ChrR-like cupin domain-containing protein n=1 Tax=Hyphomonas pacifica TaxID=1280941 RepID=A0A062TY01_9PROT|nr:ChrR family anti-sigma-E factor [Hyphomonas pacifica]KCZ50907.1 hypothetical protein HY2_12935 [Hyphomonas pacifica]RAN33460.1 hypothetical protein HY3_12985 [Hyphomonas pacifica]
MPTSPASAFGELYSAYAAGRLDPAFALMLETQSMLRPQVRQAMAVGETVSGLMLERDQPAAMSANSGARALAMIDEMEAAASAPDAALRLPEEPELSELPEPLREPALMAYGDMGWQNLASGIRRLGLDVGSALEVELYRIQPGARVPRHTHGGQEFTLVVSGGFTDETGSYGPGDMAINGPEDTHQPVGDADGICYALAVRDSGLRFTGVMGLVQRLLGK